MQNHERNVVVTVWSGLGNKTTCSGLGNHLCLHWYIRYIAKHVHTRHRHALPGLLTQHRGKNVHVYIVSIIPPPFTAHESPRAVFLSAIVMLCLTPRRCQSLMHMFIKNADEAL